MEPSLLTALGHAPVEIHAVRRWLREERWASPSVRLEDHMIVLVESGRLDVAADGVTHPLEGGMAIWMAPGTVRSFLGHRAVQHNLRFAIAGDATPHRPPLLRPGAADLVPLLRQLRDVFEHPGSLASERARGLLLALCATFLELPATPAAGLDAAQRARVAELFDARPAIGAAELAEGIGLTHDWFARRFRATWGIAPRSWLVRERMRLAAERLQETDAPIEAVARSVGVAHHGLFCRQFKAAHGCSPSQWRQGRR